MEYLEFKDSQYSFGSKVINTALTAGSLMGFSPAKRMLKRRATKFAVNKTANGAAGVIGSKLGVDKNSVRQLMDGVGATSGIEQGLTKGWGTTKLGKGIMKADAKMASAVSGMGDRMRNMKERLKLQRSETTGPTDSSTNG